MCRLMILTNATKIDDKILNKVINTSAELITEQDNDGFGWVAQGEHSHFGERTNEVEGFKTRRTRPTLSNRLNKLPFAEICYEMIGNPKQKIVGGLMFHGRTSTNDKTLRNTHPLSKNGWSLVHNGVVTNLGPKYEMVTTNDTEHLLHYMSSPGLAGTNASRIESIEKYVSGYYAFGAFDSDGHLHIVKDATAGLTCSYINSIDSYVYATTRDLIEELCRVMKWKFEPVANVSDNVYAVFKKNELVHSQYITPIGMTSRWEQDLASTSLHYKSEDEDDNGVWGIKRTTREGIPVLDASKAQEKETNKVINLHAARQAINESKSTVNYSDALDNEYLLEEMEEYAKYYTIYDKYDREIDYAQFKELDTNDKLNCIIVDPLSGEPVDPWRAGNY